MAKIKVKLDKRAKSRSKDGKFPLVLHIAHQSTTRLIPFDLHLEEGQFDDASLKLTGIQNSVRHSKRIKKVYGDVDLWVDENHAEIKLWSISKLKDEIEKRFFNKQSELSLLGHASKMLYWFYQEGKFKTIDTYEDGLKMLIKYRIRLKGGNDKRIIKTLFRRDPDNGFFVLDEFQSFDMPLKAFDYEFANSFKAYMKGRGLSANTVSIHLRSLQSFLNNAERSISELAGHKPLEGIKKTSTANEPVVLEQSEVVLFRSANYKKGSPDFHVVNYFLFMFGNMGMNFFDMALAKCKQFDGERFNYTRKKTEREGDHFSIKQSDECLEILKYYMKGKGPDDYIFPLLSLDIPKERIHRVKADKANWFNKRMKNITANLKIAKNVTTYTARDTWTNLGLRMGIDITKISSGLGHSSVQVTEKHYKQALSFQILDMVNAQITA